MQVGRVIQVCFVKERRSWEACNDLSGFGGPLSPIILVNKEARNEAMRCKVAICGKLIDPMHDTILVTDPTFTLRNPRKLFLSSENMGKLQNIALSTEVYQVMKHIYYRFPWISDGPATILRHLPSLKTFCLAISEDDQSELFEDAYDHPGPWEDRDMGDAEERENEEMLESHQAILGEISHESLPRNRNGNLVFEAKAELFLRGVERKAVQAILDYEYEYLIKTGIIRFHDLNRHPAFSSEEQIYRGDILRTFSEELKSHPDWVEPSIKVVYLGGSLN